MTMLLLLLLLLFGSCISLPSLAFVNVSLSCGTRLVGLAATHSEPFERFLSVPYANFTRRFTHSNQIVCSAYAGPVVNATTLGPMCLQFDPIENRPMAEDCLSLDIYVPARKRTKPFDVFVWFHGGSNVMGSSTGYGGLSTLATENNVIVVSVNYRLGLHGYLALDELSREQHGHSGNYGIGDAIAALEWVRSEIASFGGDPRRVTVFGQSSGGTIALALLQSGRAAGLFAAAISLSGSPNITMSLSSASAQNLALIQSVRGSNGAPLCTDLACLRAMPARTLTTTYDPLYNVDTNFPISKAYGVHWPGLVIVDGSVVDTPSDQIVFSVPTLLQSTDNELITFLPAEALPSSGTEWRAWIAGNLTASWGASTAAAIIARYEQYEPAYNAHTKFMADYGAALGIVTIGDSGDANRFVTRLVAPPGNPSGLQVLSNASIHVPGHIFDTMLAFRDFGFFGRILQAPEYQPTADDIAVGDTMRVMWVQLIDNSTGLCTFASGGCHTVIGRGGALARNDKAMAQRKATLEARGFANPLYWWSN
jgi:carboxylesterase type B